MNKQKYPTDFISSQWAIIEQMIPPSKLGSNCKLEKTLQRMGQQVIVVKGTKDVSVFGFLHL